MYILQCARTGETMKYYTKDEWSMYVKERNKEIIRLYESGMNTRQIFESGKFKNRTGNNLSIRTIQGILQLVRNGNKIGRTSHAKIFSLEDIHIIMRNPDMYQELIENRFKDYYINRGMNNNLLKSISLANKVLARDGFKCRECGQVYDLECHHKTHKYDGTRKEIDNCVTLCRTCHLKVKV